MFFSCGFPYHPSEGEPLSAPVQITSKSEEDNHAKSHKNPACKSLLIRRPTVC